MDSPRRAGNEFDFIDWVRSQTPAGSAIVGPGDDCAVIPLGNDLGLLKVDSCLDGSHFQFTDHDAPGFATPEQVGYKVMARTISDIAAMGGTPRYATVATALPQGAGNDLREGLVRGLLAAAAPFNVELVGGDTKSWSSERLAISVSLFGVMEGRTPVLRSGAQAGDALFVTGQLGGSLHSGRHLHPTPRIAEGQWLAAQGASSMIDLSDGLSGDLWQLCKASAVAAALHADALPVNSDSTLEGALHDGEDFELLFNVPGASAEAIARAWPFQTRLTRIGTMLAGKPEITLIERGQRTPLAIKGYEHRL